MNLARIQFLSVATKAITTVLGIIQSIIIIRVLSPTEYGIVGLVMSIGGLIGVSQHLGIVDGAIREIAVRKQKDEIGKVFWISHLARQVVTLPLSLALFILAGFIATTIYHRPEIIPFIELFALALILQGLQDVLGATLTGMKKFVPLYAIQIITAAVNIVAFGYLTWKFQVQGFFWAVIITTLIMIILLSASSFRALAGHLAFPTWGEIKKYGKNLLRIGAFMYLSRIFYVIWQKLPLLLLGGILTGNELGYINASLTFGSKLVILAAALSEVNLSWMSTLFANKKEEFTRAVSHNMYRVFVLLSALTCGLIFFVPEILHYIIRKQEYMAAAPYIILLTLAFFLYSLIDLATSSIFVAANNPKLRALIFGVLVAISGIGSLLTLYSIGTIMTAALAMLASAAVAYAITAFITWRSFRIQLLPPALLVLIGAIAASSMWLLSLPPLSFRIGALVLILAYTGILALRHARHREKHDAGNHEFSVVCFAGALFDQTSWTNRQHIMAQFSKTHPVLYIEPRVWIFRYVMQHLLRPKEIWRLLRKLTSYEKRDEHLYIKAQWNLLPGSREFSWISKLNHVLNRRSVLAVAKDLGFLDGVTVVWIYDTEAAQYLPSFKNAVVAYDCVDNHAVQAGVNRNPKRVHEEERKILRRADITTVTSKRLLKMKRKHTKNIHLVLNAGDVELFQRPLRTEGKQRAKKDIGAIKHPILGSVGALDSYKYDFDLLLETAKSNPEWQFVFVGSPIVEKKTKALKELTKLSNVHVLGSIPREFVPAYVSYFDVCLIPYKNNVYNEASFPLKFWEFMATGKPIVASGVPELAEYQPLISYAENATQYTNAIQDILQKQSAGSQKRIAMARHHGWADRARQLMKLLQQTITETI